VLIAFVILLASFVLARNDTVLDDTYHYTAGAQAEPSFVTPVFEFKGASSNAQVYTRTDLSNNWAYFNYALINEETGQAYDFGREVSYYSGTDSDGSWTEGSRSDTATLSAIPAGRYYLRVEPEVAPGLQAMSYSIRVRRDVPSMGYFWLVLLLLPIPAVMATYRRFGFESRRWADSDYGSSISVSSGDDDD
jgi:hypothetical protein